MTDQTFAALNLNGNPFSMATSREGFYHTQATRAILDELAHGIETRKGFMVLIGEVGVGKTSLSLQLFGMLDGAQTIFAWVFNSMFTKEELFRAIAHDFGLVCERDFSLLDYQRVLHDFFLATHAAGQTAVIAVDEAHNLSDDSLEALRMLGNFEFDGQKLVQVILFAQPELAMRLEQPGLRQFKSRIAIYQVLPQFGRDELIGYVNFKLSQAGSQLQLSGAPARLLWRATLGNVRQAKLIMERVLYGCLAYRTQAISTRIMRMAIREVCDSGRALYLPRGSRSWAPWWAGAACVLLFALTLVPFWSHQGQQVRALDVFADMLRPRPIAPAQHGAPVPAPVPAPVHDLTNATAALDGFLGSPLAETVRAAVRQAVAEKKPERIREVLPPTVAMAMVEKLPPAAHTPPWLVLPWQQLSQVPPQWLVLWHTEYPVDTPAPGQTSPLVRAAQERLRELGHFDKPVGGMLNSATWYAVGIFQRTVGLPATGTLDPATVFWLRFFTPSTPAQP